MRTILKVIIFCAAGVFLLFGIRFNEYLYPSIQMVIDVRSEGLNYNDITVAWYKPKPSKRSKYESVERSNAMYNITTKPMRGGITTFWGFITNNQHPTTFKNLKITWKGLGKIKLSINDIKTLPQETRPSGTTVYILDKVTFLTHLEKEE